jgi:4'-phosphopantetheinyl transferase EntD
MRFPYSIHSNSIDGPKSGSATGGSSAVPMRASVLGLFPAGVHGAELTGFSERFPLWPNELEAVSRASGPRAAEFAAGRHCARSALRLLGHAPVGIPCLPTNAPGWPDAITGSVSHSAGYCGAVVAWNRDVGAVGFDVECRRSVSSPVLFAIASEAEIARLASESNYSAADLPTVLFSAKESYYKAHHQAYGSELDFLDVAFRVVGPESFAITHCNPANADADCCAPRMGRYLIDARHVFTAMAWQ